MADVFENQELNEQALPRNAQSACFFRVWIVMVNAFHHNDSVSATLLSDNWPQKWRYIQVGNGNVAW